MTNKHLESISALLDDEVNHAELDEALQNTSDNSQQADVFSRYSLIGDVLRNEQILETDQSFAANIQAAIANVEQDVVEPEQSQAPENASVVNISSHANWRSKVADKVKTFSQSASGRNSAQFAIAASVALVAVFGVSNMSPTDSQYSAPVAQTTPLVDGVAPVSAASGGVQQKASANQITQSRINALIADHQQQLKVADDKKDSTESTEDKKVIEP